MSLLTAKTFLGRLQALQSDEELAKIGRYFKTGDGQYGAGDRFIGVRMGLVFDLAREFVDMAPDEIEALMDSDIHEARAGAIRLMANQYARKGTPVARQQQLYELYLRRHDRINNWDLVDLGAWSVVGAWLIGKPHDVLYQLAKSSNLWERRTAILATFAFIKRGDLADAFAISELLMSDAEDLIHKASGGMLRAAGDKDLASLTGFLDSHAARMPRVMLRYAIEKLTPDRRRHYLGLAKA